jgi:hypothetical protein
LSCSWRRAALRPFQCQPPVVLAKPLAAAVTARDVVGPQAHRQDTASVGLPIDGDPTVSGAANGIGRIGLVSLVVTRWMFDIWSSSSNRLIRARLLVTWPFFTRSENMP